VLKNLLLTSLVLLSSVAQATYIYEANQSLYDLQTNSSGSTGLGSNDDAVSGAFNIGFTFDFYGQSFTQARMATNGCLHFNLTGSYCGDYTPDPLPQYTNTLFPFWTDLIKDNGSAMKAKAFDDYTIFGWYNMREYNRANSDNSIEVWLYPNNTFEYRYGELDIISHDVLIGEQGPTTSDIYTYLFHDECNTGTTNVAGTCVNTNWNSTASNTSLEDGGSLYGVGSGNALDCSNALNDSSCAGYDAAYLAQQCDLNDLYSDSCPGYAAAYLTQQCDITQLYSNTCPNYWDAYDEQQCDEDSQYSPSCPGYEQEASVAYYVEEEFDYGTEEDSCITNPDWCYDDPYAGMELTDEEWYAIDVEEFGQEQVDEWYGAEVAFDDTGMVDWESTELQTYNDIDEVMDLYEEELWVEEIYIVEAINIEEERIEYIEEIRELETFSETQSLELDIFDAEELTELYEFDTIIREELDYEEEVFAIREEVEDEHEEEMEELQEESELMDLEEETEKHFAETETEGKQENKKSSVRVSALSVVAGTLRTAEASVVESDVDTTASVEVSGSNYANNELFNNVLTENNNSNYGSTTSASTSNANSSSVISSSGGMSTSSSPSRSDQFASSTAQTQQVLSMSSVAVTDAGGSSSSFSGSSSSVSINITPMPTVDNSPQVVMAEVQVTNMDNQIDTAVSGVMTASEADQVADQIIAQNIETQQEQAEEELQETGEYADQSTLVAYLGYVPGFNSYRDAQIPNQDSWYTPRAIYADANIADNTQAFYQLAGASLNTLGEMIDLQPTL
tara:strand:- start:12751 stop:15126 length:2376 start_codon:yes stop_codon:yes gene_type:complete